MDEPLLKSDRSILAMVRRLQAELAAKETRIAELEALIASSSFNLRLPGHTVAEALDAALTHIARLQRAVPRGVGFGKETFTGDHRSQDRTP
jgi:hypothetical protein